MEDAALLETVRRHDCVLALCELGSRVPTLLRAGWPVRYWLPDPSDHDALLQPLAGPALTSWRTQAAQLRFVPIATVYAQQPQAQGAVLAAPMLALRARPEQPAQFVFDRGQLGGPAGLLAFVISTSEGSRVQLQAQVLTQAREQLGLAHLVALQTVVEKRATFACTPALQRPPMTVAPGLWACGDYIDGPYPATLEGAVRSGCAVAQMLCAPGRATSTPKTTG